jgi:hypothetical protein
VIGVRRASARYRLRPNAGERRVQKGQSKPSWDVSLVGSAFTQTTNIRELGPTGPRSPDGLLGRRVGGKPRSVIGSTLSWLGTSVVVLIRWWARGDLNPHEVALTGT